MRAGPHKRTLVIAALLAYVLVACLNLELGPEPRQGWWDGLGPVLPHDTFPANCELCHVGQEWQSLTESFTFDHELETGVPLVGAHDRAQCLRCHNDRGPVAVFEAQGCAGCHEDIHLGSLGPNCLSCHTQESWKPYGQVARHNRTRFPLAGIHASTSCRRCHLGAEVGRFLPQDTECVTCHADDLAGALIPNHQVLGWTYRCDRCHQPTNWHQVEVDPNF